MYYIVQKTSRSYDLLFLNVQQILPYTMGLLWSFKDIGSGHTGHKESC